LNAPVRLAVLVLAGALQAAAIATPWSGQPAGWLQLLSLAALVALLAPLRHAARGWRSALGQGWLFATAWLSGSFWWLFISMHTYGGLPAPLAAIAVLALAAGLASYYAVACAAWVRWAPARPVGAAALFAALWTLAELVRGSWFTGFPWGAGGYAHVDGVLAGYAPWLGAYGLGAVAALIAACVALALRPGTPGDRRRRAVALRHGVIGTGTLAVLALAAPWVLQALHGNAFTRSSGQLDVALLQGNIAQDEKFIPNGGVAVALQWYGEQLRDARASLVVTPETALPMLPQQLPPGYLEAIAQRYSAGEQAALVGIPFVDGQRRYANRLLGFAPGAAPYSYDKHHLVPFGEFIPWGFRWFVHAMNIPLGDFSRGGLGQPVFNWRGQRIAPNICYEDLFGDEIGVGFRDAASAPTILLNVSNIAWFGDTVAIDEHLSISRMRALEFQRPMVRATNTGATAVIDHTGRVTHMLPRLTRGVLEAPVEGRDGLTPFAWWVSRFGLWPLWLAALAVVAVAIAAARRQR